MIKFHVFALTTLFLVLTNPSAPLVHAQEMTYGEAWREDIGGYPVLHLKGSEYEMGKQYGYFVGDLIQDNIKNITEIARAKKKWLKFVPRGVFTGIKRMIGRVFWRTFSTGMKDHVRGILAGAADRDQAIRLNRYDIAFLNALIDVGGIVSAKIGEDSRAISEAQITAMLRELEIPTITNNCDTLAVFGRRTEGGKTFQLRNSDIDTGLGLEKHPVVLMMKHPEKIPVAAASFAGMAGVFSGMNAEGLAMGQVWAFSWDVKIDTPWPLRMREIFMDAHSAAEAVEKLREHPTLTYGSNFVLADGAGGAFAIEMSGANMDVFAPNDPRELDLKVRGETVGLPLEDAVFRGDLTLGLKLRARQTAARGPTGDPRVSQAYQRRYQGLYERVLAYELNGVVMGHKELEQISRETAMDQNLQDIVYANTDRDFWLAVAQIQPDGTTLQASQRPYEYMPFSKYLTDVTVDPVIQQFKFTSWLPVGHALSSEVLTLMRGDSVVGSMTVGDVVSKGASGHTLHIPMQAGEVYSLRTQDGTLVERVIIP